MHFRFAHCDCQLPELRSTEDAIAFGRNISPGQFVFLSGAQAALQREFDEIRDVTGTTQLQADLAFKIQLLREALEEAPQLTRMALLS